MDFVKHQTSGSKCIVSHVVRHGLYRWSVGWSIEMLTRSRHPLSDKLRIHTLFSLPLRFPCPIFLAQAVLAVSCISPSGACVRVREVRSFSYWTGLTTVRHPSTSSKFTDIWKLCWMVVICLLCITLLVLLDGLAAVGSWGQCEWCAGIYKQTHTHTVVHLHEETLILRNWVQVKSIKKTHVFK